MIDCYPTKVSDGLVRDCPDSARLRALLDGVLPEGEQGALNGHLENCTRCQETLESLVAGHESWVGTGRELGEGRPVREQALQQAMQELRGQATGPQTQCLSGDRKEPELDFLSPPKEAGHLGRLDHYEVIEVIGRGGMGVVLKAFDEALHRVAAIKVLAPQLATSATARKRFIREAQAAAAVIHDHVVTIHAVDEINGLPYLVMPYVAGVSLQERLDCTGPLELKEILRIGMQTASGLAAAHGQGLVHRDIKPANILLENGVERVKITDFGLARAVDDASLSQSGVVAGTPQYMAPEQARGEGVDHRADLFSLGSVLYALCTGRAPFRASTNMAVLKRVCEETPRPIRETNPEIPDWLVDIIAKLHAKDPADRFQSAAEVTELLGQHLAHLQQPSLVPLPPRIQRHDTAPANHMLTSFRARHSRRSRWVTGVALLFGFLLLMAYWLYPAFVRLVTGKGTLEIGVSKDDDIDFQNDLKVTILRGGQKIAVIDLKDQDWTYLEPGFYELVPEGPTGRMEISPKQFYLAPRRRLVATISVRREVAQSQPSKPLEVLLPARQFGPHGSGANSVAYVPGGRQFVSGGTDGAVRLWDLTSRTEIRRFKGHTGPVEGVAVSPAADCILSCGQDKTIRLWNIGTGKEIRRFVGHRGWVYGVAFSPDGKLALSAGTSWGGTADDNFPRLWDVQTGQEIHRFHGHADAVLGVAFSPDGRRALSASFDRSVRLWDVASGRELHCFPHTSRVYAVAFSPDGRQFISGCGGNSLKDGAVFDPVNCVMRLWDIDGAREVRQFRGHTAAIRTLAWSPDGRYILSAASGEYFDASQWQPPSEVGIRLWEAATGRQLCRFNAPSSIGSLAFASDGRTFLSGGGGGSLGLWELPQSLVKGHEETGRAQLESGVQPFIILPRDGKAELKFATLAEAAAAARDGDTIEVCGNGPFVTRPITINAKALTIRAATGFQPIIRLAAGDADTNAPLVWTDAALVLEGLRMERISQTNVWKAGMEPYITVWSVGAPLHVVNCLFCQRGGTACIFADKESAVCNLRNCAFLTPDSAVWWWCGSGGRLSMANCLHNGFHSLVATYRGPLHDVAIDLKHNTFAANDVLLFCLVAPGIATNAGIANPISLNASENVFYSLGALLQFNQTPEFLANNKELQPNEAKDLLRRLVRWHDERNAYALQSHFGVFTKANLNESVGNLKTLEDWLRFWGIAESQSLPQRARSNSEDLFARVRTFSAEKVSPVDFRLHPGSLGYQAGKDGRDLGANVDLVGPGPAYERWKKTPAYQQWVKSTGESRVGR